MRPHRWQPTRLRRPWDSPGKNTGVGCHFLLQCMKVKSESEVAQSCLTLCDPMDYSLPNCSVHRTLQARILEWVAISFSRGTSQPRDRIQVSCMASGFFTRETLQGHCYDMNVYIPQCGGIKMWACDFPGGPVVKNLNFQCRGCRFDCWLEN